MKRFTVFAVAAIVFLFSCNKENFITGSEANLNLSSDTIRFDTVFVTTGSVTQSFKIFNSNNQKLMLTHVKLMGGSNSSFHININGSAVDELNNIEIAANDSIYVFVNVTIDPSSNNLPFIISDSISILYNGNEKLVQLQAYGQNAHFLNNEIITGQEVWNNDLPYVILGSLRIDTTASLMINAGCRIYAHADAPLLVDGTLQVMGEKNSEVTFSGDRLDEYYRDLPASWPGLYFRKTSKDNVMKFAVVRNAYQAVVTEGPSVNVNPKLTLHQCIIDNALDAGLLSVNSFVDADNCLISNCGNNIKIIKGGDYHFTNCTAVAYSNIFMLHDEPVLQLYDFSYENGNLVTANLNATFTNCIFWGDNGGPADEISLNRQGAAVNVAVDHCLYKSLNTISDITSNSNILNEDPVFDSINIQENHFDFRMNNAALSPATDNGAQTGFSNDLDNNPRMAGAMTDIGCYEKQ